MYSYGPGWPIKSFKETKIKRIIGIVRQENDLTLATRELQAMVWIWSTLEQLRQDCNYMLRMWLLWSKRKSNHWWGHRKMNFLTVKKVEEGENHECHRMHSSHTENKLSAAQSLGQPGSNVTNIKDDIQFIPQSFVLRFFCWVTRWVDWFSSFPWQHMPRQHNPRKAWKTVTVLQGNPSLHQLCKHTVYLT